MHTYEDADRSVSETLDDLLKPDIVRSGGSLVILWSGHGEQTRNGGLNLVTRNTKPGAAAFLMPQYPADLAARTGASQILLILDTCFSGGGVSAAVTIAEAILEELPPNAPRIWLGVAASSLSLQKARDGAFGALLVKLLRSGPTDEELKKRWSAHSAGVRGDDLLDALEKEWTNAPDQAIKTRSGGNAWVMLPNPIYKPAPPERMDAHLLRAARGGEPDEERSYFTGRVAQINRVVAWICRAAGDVRRDRLSGQRQVRHHRPHRQPLGSRGARAPARTGDPRARRSGEGSVHAHVHALRYTAERLVAAIDEQLVRGGFLVPDANGRRNRGELLGAIQRSPRRPVIAIDGLNESGAESWRMAEDVLRLLSEVALVLVDAESASAEGPLSLIQAVGAKVVVDLDDPALHDETERDLRRYVEKRLANAAGPSMDVAKVASMMLELSGAQNAGAFLLAQVITTQLRGVPVDTSRRTWEKALASSIEQRVERFVGDAPPLNRNELSLPQAARELLEALAWAKGPGMPDDIWPLAATALSATKTTYERSDVFWLLGRTERYVLEDGQGGRAVYRLVHQWLLEQLRPESAGTSNEPLTIDAPAVRLARALVDYYLELLRAGQAPQTHAYLWRYTWQHCADAGELGIQRFGRWSSGTRKPFRWTSRWGCPR